MALKGVETPRGDANTSREICFSGYMMTSLIIASFKINNLFKFYSFPVALDQIYFVLVLISTNHNARYLYPKKDISLTEC